MTTALAIRPQEQALEFRRCTGHCCDPVKLVQSPGRLRRLRHHGDIWWILANLEYVGWRPPSEGGWPDSGTHLYRCPHYNRAEQRCTIYGQGKRSRLCREHPEYGRLWDMCEHKDCTRRTVVIDMDDLPLRWRFPDLWAEDYRRWKAWEQEACRPEWGPEAMPQGADE